MEFSFAEYFSSECLEDQEFPWFMLYLLGNRAVGLSECTTYLSMSAAKVLLILKSDLYVNINSNIVINVIVCSIILIIGSDTLVRLILPIILINMQISSPLIILVTLIQLSYDFLRIITIYIKIL